MNEQQTIKTNGGDRVEALRQILEAKQMRSVSYGEAKEISVTLIGFYQLLADDGGSAD